MWAHLATTMPSEQFESLRAEAESQGLVRPREASLDFAPTGG